MALGGGVVDPAVFGGKDFFVLGTCVCMQVPRIFFTLSSLALASLAFSSLGCRDRWRNLLACDAY